MFLTEDAMFQTLRDIASLAPGTEIVFDHLSATPAPEERRHLDILKPRK